MDKPICPSTGEIMERGYRQITISYKGQSKSFDMPGWYCEACDEGIHTGKDMQASDRALNALKAEVEGLLSPCKIKLIRKRLGLTQAQAGQLIGGGPRAFQKYEAGDLLPSRALSSALLLLASDPSRVQELENPQLAI